MNRIEAKFRAFRSKGKTALIPFIQAGDPDLPTTLRLLRALEDNGADLIELGIPFSDPMADGPTIQRASERALKSGASLERVLDLLRTFRQHSDIPVVLFGYYNPIFRYGVKRLARAARIAGADGLLCVDLPPEESVELKKCVDREGLDLIFLLAPTSNADRTRLVAQKGRGFVYYVSVTGVTGARKTFEEQLRSQVKRIRRYTALPVGVGFGISSPKQAAWIASFADAAIVGSALIQLLEGAGRNEDKVRRVGAFVRRIRKAMDGARKPRRTPDRIGH